MPWKCNHSYAINRVYIEFISKNINTLDTLSTIKLFTCTHLNVLFLTALRALHLNLYFVTTVRCTHFDVRYHTTASSSPLQLADKFLINYGC